MRKWSMFFVPVCVGAALLLLGAGCSTSMYEDPENWVIADNDTPAFFAEYDLIFLYPTQEEEAERGYMNWMSGILGEEVRRYVRMVISSQFGPRVRVFSPFVPMMGFREYGEIMEKFKRERQHSFDFYKTPLRVPIDHMVEALDVYFTRYNPDGHPFVIYGQGQGALVLYEAMQRCSKIKPKNGFVAGYFFGLPGVTEEELVDQFGGRGIMPAHRRNSVGVIAICNTWREGDPIEKTLALANGAVVNPLSWRVDAAPSGRKANPGSLFFNHKEQNPAHKIKIVHHFCGAEVDRENGLVKLVDIQPGHKFKLVEGHFGSDVWGVFAKSVSMNARERVLMYKFLKKGIKLPERAEE